MYKLLTAALLTVSTLLLFSFGENEQLCKYVPEPTRSGGVAAVLGIDRTGGPLSGGATCTQCHSGGAFSPSILVQVKDGGGNVVNSYAPGTTYTVEFTVAAGAGTPAGYGMQATALTSSNNAGGNFTTVTTPNTQVTTLGAVKYIEHQSINAAGFFQANWTAPAVGTGSVSFYAVGNAVNANFSTTGDAITAPVTVTLTEEIQTTINYPGNPFCSNEGNQTPVITGDNTGVFSSGVGLSINPVNGEIDVAGSTTGTYTVLYTYSTGSTTASVTINPTYSETAAVTICSNETYQFGSQTLDSTNAGSNVELFQSVNGCDSLVDLFLTVNPTFSSSSSATICENETIQFGSQTLDASNAGSNFELYQAVNGCDSLVELILNVNFVDEQITVAGQQISANQGGAIYRWLDCDNGFAIIPGESNQTFAPAVSGNYAVEVTFNGCVDTSSCQAITVIGLEEHLKSPISVAPNPMKEFIEITGFSELKGIEYVRIIDASGRVVKEAPIKNSLVDVRNLTKGTYYLLIKHSVREEKIMLVKE